MAHDPTRSWPTGKGPNDTSIPGAAWLELLDEQAFPVVGAGAMVWNGTMWTPVSTQNRLPVEATLTGQMVDIQQYHKGNPLPGTTAADFEIRDSEFHNYEVYQARDTGLTNWDTMIMIRHTFDCWIHVSIRILYEFAGQARLGPLIQNSVPMPPAGSDRACFAWVPRRGLTIEETSHQRVIELPELSLPYNRFRISVRPRESDAGGATPVVPTTGELEMTIVRRY